MTTKIQSSPLTRKTTYKRLIFNYFKELLTRFYGTAMSMDLSTMDNDHDQLLRIQGEWCYHANEEGYSWNFINAQILSFDKVSVWIKYKGKKWEEVYSGPSSIYLSPNTVYSEKLSKAFAIPSNKSIYLGGIDDIRIRFEGGKLTTIY